MEGFGRGNVGGNWGPPALQAGLLEYYNNVGLEGAGKLADILGGAIGGGIRGVRNDRLAEQGGAVADDAPRGFMSGAANGALAEAGGEEFKRIQDAGRSADLFYKSLGEDGQSQTGIHPEQWKTLGSREKAAAMTGFVKAQGAQEMMARLKDYAAQAEYRQQQANEDEAVGQAVNTYATAPDVPTGEGDLMRPASADERFRAALQTPGLGGRGVPKLIDALTKYGASGMDGEGVVTEAGPYPGIAIVRSRSGRGGIHIVEDPSARQAGGATFFQPGQRTLELPPEIAKRFSQVVTGPNSSTLVPVYGDNISALPIVGPNGESLGYGMPTGKGGSVTALKDPSQMSSNERTSLLRLKKEYLAERAKAFLPEDKQHWDEAVGEVERQLGGQNAQGGNPTVTTKQQYDKLPSGTVYMGKDGKKYRKP